MMFGTNSLNSQRAELTAALERGDEKLRVLLARNVKTIRAGETFVAAAEKHDYIYRLRKGWAGRTRTLPDGRAQNIIIFLPGDMFAVKSAFLREHPDAIEALSNVVVEQIHHDEIRKLFEVDSDIALRCTWQLVEEERRLHSWVVGLGRGAVSERLAYLLLQFRFRLASYGTIKSDGVTFEVPMTQQQLADHLGVSLVHMNRNLMRFREAGLIDLKGRVVTLTNLDELGKYAYPLFDPFEIETPNFAMRSPLEKGST